MNMHSASLQPHRTPVSIITGSLGSGKTTVLSNLLRHPTMESTLVIVNEFGDVGLDHLLIYTPDDEILLLENGCLCCTVQGDLVNTLRNLVDRLASGDASFDRLIIETTGLADPIGVLQTVLNDPVVSACFIMDAIICVVDAVNCDIQIEDLPECARQISVADHILLSKADLIEQSGLSLLQARLADMNPTAIQHVTLCGKIQPHALFGAGPASTAGDPSRLDRWLSAGVMMADAGRYDAVPYKSHEVHSSKHPSDQALMTFTIWYEQPIAQEGLLLWLNLLINFWGAKLLRVKGLLSVDSTSTVIHGIRHLLHEPVALDKWPGNDFRSRIVFITQGLDRSAIELSLPILKLNPSLVGETLNPGRYTKFVEVFQHFRQT